MKSMSMLNQQVVVLVVVNSILNVYRQTDRQKGRHYQTTVIFLSFFWWLWLLSMTTDDVNVENIACLSNSTK